MCQRIVSVLLKYQLWMEERNTAPTKELPNFETYFLPKINNKDNYTGISLLNDFNHILDYHNDNEEIEQLYYMYIKLYTNHTSPMTNNNKNNNMDNKQISNELLYVCTNVSIKEEEKNTNEDINTNVCFCIQRHFQLFNNLKTNENQIFNKKYYWNISSNIDILYCQMLDKMHCHILHSFDLGLRLKSNDLQSIFPSIYNSFQITNKPSFKLL